MEDNTSGEVDQVSTNPESQVDTTILETESESESLKKQIKELRAESAKYRTKAKEYEIKVEKYETGILTEQEKLQKQLEGLQNTIKEKEVLVRKSRIDSLTQKHNLIDRDIVEKLLADTDDDNLETAITDLLVSKPYLKSGHITNISSGSAANPSKDGANPSYFTQDQLRDFNFYIANKEQIFKAAKEGRIKS